MDNVFISCITFSILRAGQLPSEGIQPVKAEQTGKRKASLAAEGKAPKRHKSALDDKELVSKGKRGGRGAVTLKDLIDAGLLDPGRDKLVVHYKGTSYKATLHSDGAIIYADKRYMSATAFSIMVKRLQTPNKQGDDGWKSVLYDGTSLDVFRWRFTHSLPEARGSPQPEHEATPAKGEGGEHRTPAAKAKPKEVKAEEGPEAPPEVAVDQWVQCDRCQTWRNVPNEHWEAVQQHRRFACRQAKWDVTKLAPFTPSCGK